MKESSIFASSKSHFSFTNPLHVEDASIGTVLKTFVLFLFLHEWRCFLHRKSILNPKHLSKVLKKGGCTTLLKILF